jgi:uncharacterized protein (TIGR02172 family)
MDTNVIGYGRTADVSLCDGACVIKLFKPFLNEAAVEREFRVASFAHRAGLSTPKPERLVDRDGRKGIVYERVDGVSLLRAISENPLRMTALAKSMAALHCRINDVPFADAEYAQKAYIECSIRHAREISEGDKERIIVYLRSLPDGSRLCHGDFHPDNILMTEKPWIIDWMTGSSGTPACDLARSKLLLETGEIPGSVPPATRFILKVGQRKLARTYVAEYRRIRKLKRADVDAWMLPLYAARLVEHLTDVETRTILAKLRHEMSKRLKRDMEGL